MFPRRRPESNPGRLRGNRVHYPLHYAHVGHSLLSTTLVLRLLDSRSGAEMLSVRIEKRW